MTSEPTTAAPVTEQIQGCIRLDGQPLQYVPLDVQTPGRAITADVTGEGTAASLGAGIARFENIDFEWVHPCDEAVYVITGELVVAAADASVTGRAGDILFMSKGARLRYRTTGMCTVFAAMNLSPDHIAGDTDE